MVTAATNRILVVDDETDMRNGLQKVLSRKGYSVDTAEDGLRAVEKMKQSSFQVVIADLKMPRMNGIDVLRKAKDINQAIAVIIITGYGTVASAVESMRLGAFDYIAKPFKPDDISLIVEKALKTEGIIPQIEDQETVPPEVATEALGGKKRTGRKQEQVQERRILLEHCERTTAEVAKERIVTPENIDYFADMYPEQELRLWQ